MTVKFLEQAEFEVKKAVEYYNSNSNGWGFEFAFEIQKTISRIIANPEAWTKISKRARKCKCNKFPYSVIYFLDKEEIIVVAIMHLKRKPNYWVERS